MSLVQAASHVLSAQPQIAAALQQASTRTGADFNYLLKTAMRESSLDCSAKSATSTACGLFQFTQQTWLGTMKQDGAELGLGQYAGAIRQDSRGRYVVDDPALRREILALRNDPQVSALMAGAYTRNSQQTLESRLGREVDGGELYIAHFLGAGGATKLIRSAGDTPGARADKLFPEAAAANRSIFYGTSGRPRTVAEVYENLVSRHQDTAAPVAPRPDLAAGMADTGMDEESDLEAAEPGNSPGRGWASPDRTNPAWADRTAPSGRISVNQTIPNQNALGRSALRLSPAVVQILASLSVPDSAPPRETEQSADTAAVPASERRPERRLLPRSGFAYG